MLILSHPGADFYQNQNLVGVLAVYCKRGRAGVSPIIGTEG
jgi:hypothetical protein